MEKKDKKPDLPKKKNSKIGKFLHDYIGIFWMTLAFPLIFLITYYEIFILNINSYRIISTFCSIIIGFGINAYIIILKLDINSISDIKNEIGMIIKERYAEIVQDEKELMKIYLNWKEKFDKIRKRFEKAKKKMLKKIKRIIFIAFGIVLLSIFAVSSSITIPMLFEIVFIYAICIIGYLVILIFKKLPIFNSFLGNYRVLLEKKKLQYSGF